MRVPVRDYLWFVLVVSASNMYLQRLHQAVLLPLWQKLVHAWS